MTIIETLNDKLNQIKNGDMSKKEILTSQLSIISECENVLLREDLFNEYDFSNIINILNNYDLTITDLEKLIMEIKEVINVKQSFPNLSFTLNYSENQKKAIEQLKANLEKTKENLKKQIEQLEDIDEDKIGNLEDLKNILEGKGKKKFYTDEMLDSLMDVVDFTSISSEEFDSLITGLYSASNFRRRNNVIPKENIENVINLYKEFLDESEFAKNEKGKYIGLFAALIMAHKNEIECNIDLDNSRAILNFFKEKGILSNFNRTALLKITLFANYDYVKKQYENIITEHPEEINIYYEDITVPLWVRGAKSTRKAPIRPRRKNGKEIKDKSLYAQSFDGVNEEEFRENVKLLKENSAIFDSSYPVSDIDTYLKQKNLAPEELGQYIDLLKLLTESSWALWKNLKLIKPFKLGEVYNVKLPFESLKKLDIENKIHYAIELGLLNPPMDLIYRELEKDIDTNAAYKHITRFQNISNDSIRNYFSRNISVLLSTSAEDYGYLKYKLNTLGPVGFYNYFFSDSPTNPGERSFSNLSMDIKRNMEDKKDFIMKNFIIDFYDLYVDNYDEYETVISNYNESIKTNEKKHQHYYNDTILEDELIKKLDEQHSIMDVLTLDGEEVEVRNDYVYKFGDTLISRYKVLHNASILKAKYGYLDRNMLLTSIVRESYLTEDEFNNIEKALSEGVKKL